MERWGDLVAFVLDIDLETVHTYAQGRKTFDISKRPIPVELGYYLSFHDASGRLIGQADIYGIRNKVSQILSDP